MVLFNYTTKEMTAKVVYYGPGLCGKTTNLQFVYENLPPQVKKGKMLSLATKTDRTLFFDFLPLELGRIRGMKTRVQLYTVPGQVFYNSTRKLVLRGADGIVFVADSQKKMMDSNIESYRNLEQNLKEIGIQLDEIPIVMQFNKRDLPHLAPIEEMNTLINRHNAPFYEAVGTTGIGVEDTLKAITKLVLNHLAAKYQIDASHPPGPGVSEGRPPLEAISVPKTAPTVSSTAREEAAPATGPGEPVTEWSAMSGHGGDPSPAPHSSMYSPSRSETDNLESLEELNDWGEGEPTALDSGHAPATEEVTPSSEDLEEERLTVEEEDHISSPMLTGPFSTGDTSDEDLAELLEEIPEGPAEREVEIFEESVQEIIQPARTAVSTPRTPLVPQVPSGDPVMSDKSTPLSGRRPSPSGSSSRERQIISPLDPLGIGAGRDGEMPLARAIQVGVVTPGKEHRITVPLEMSVEGRKVRLQLRMTLTIGD